MRISSIHVTFPISAVRYYSDIFINYEEIQCKNFLYSQVFQRENLKMNELSI